MKKASGVPEAFSYPIFKTVPLVDNDMDRRLRDPEPPRRRPDGGLVFDDVQRQPLGPLLHVSLHSITLPTPCCPFGRARCGSCICAEGLHHDRRRDIINRFAIYNRKMMLQIRFYGQQDMSSNARLTFYHFGDTLEERRRNRWSSTLRFFTVRKKL